MQNESLSTLKLSGEQRRLLKSLWMQRWQADGEGINRHTSAPEVADVWVSAVLDLLPTLGYIVVKKEMHNDNSE